MSVSQTCEVLFIKAFISSNILFVCPYNYLMQRSVTSVHLIHATRRVQKTVWMDRLPSRVCVNPAGRGHVVRTVSSNTSLEILIVLMQLLNKHTSYLTSNILNSDITQLTTDTFNTFKVIELAPVKMLCLMF